jgi:hypothetical protein
MKKWTIVIVMAIWLAVRPCAAEQNVALSTLGAEVLASDSLGNDTPGKLIDGIVDHTIGHRWHGSLGQPHPHWLKL